MKAEDLGRSGPSKIDLNTTPNWCVVRMQQRRRHGFTLTEIAIVLGIIGLILGAIWVAASAAHTNVKTTKLVRDILTIESGVRATYATRNSISAGCFNTAFVNMGIIPQDMVGSGQNGAVCAGQTTINDPWGKTVDVASQTGWDSLPQSASAFEIMVGFPANTMTSAECQPVLMAIAGPSEVGSGLIGVGGPGFATTTDIASITDTYFASCSGHFTLQFSLH